MDQTCAIHLTGPVTRLSDLVKSVPLDHDGLEVSLSDGATLVLDPVSTALPNVAWVSIEGSTPPSCAARPWHATTREMVPKERLTGAIACLLRAAPNIKRLRVRCVTYDVDWAGLDGAEELRHVRLWHYHAIQRPVVFPPHCTVDFDGLTPEYVTRPEETGRFLVNALRRPGVSFRWQLTYYDPAKSAIFDSVKRELGALDGTDDNHLTTPIAIASVPPDEAQGTKSSVNVACAPAPG